VKDRQERNRVAVRGCRLLVLNDFDSLLEDLREEALERRCRQPRAGFRESRNQSRVVRGAAKQGAIKGPNESSFGHKEAQARLFLGFVALVGVDQRRRCFDRLAPLLVVGGAVKLPRQLTFLAAGTHDGSGFAKRKREERGVKR
jgi:hypothetical protein